MVQSFCTKSRLLSVLGLLLLLPLWVSSQYTDIINSNRPGASVSAYAVGTNVVQMEVGAVYDHQKHDLLMTTASGIGADVALRYGLLFEPLEIVYEGTYMRQKTTYDNFDTEITRTDFTRNRLGLKFLVFDPFKNPERNKPNLYSWKANNLFRFKNLLPAVSLYAGATFNLGDNPYYPEDPVFSPRAMIATQSRLSPRFVLITNWSYDRIGTDDPEMGYIISLTRALRNPKWSVFLENQGIKSDRYADVLLRTGVAYLISENFQADINFGGSFKNTPTRFFASAGASYRLDFHHDKLLPGNGDGEIKKNSMNKKKNTDFTPTKKDKKKTARARKKRKQKDSKLDF